MNIKDWKNGRKLTDPSVLQEVKDMFFAIDPVMGETSNDELMELQSQRNRNKLNQAR